MNIGNYWYLIKHNFLVAVVKVATEEPDSIKAIQNETYNKYCSILKGDLNRE